MNTRFQITATNTDGFNRTMARNLDNDAANQYVADLVARGYSDVIAFPEGF